MTIFTVKLKFDFNIGNKISTVIIKDSIAFLIFIIPPKILPVSIKLGGITPDMAEALQKDRTAQNLLRRLGENVTVTVSSTEPSGFTVTHCRSGETIFQSGTIGIPGT